MMAATLIGIIVIPPLFALFESIREHFATPQSVNASQGGQHG
jgi:hypothetical protein